MNILGFTAEVAIYQSARTYRSTTSISAGVGKRPVVPARLRMFEDIGDWGGGGGDESGGDWTGGDGAIFPIPPYYPPDCFDTRLNYYRTLCFLQFMSCVATSGHDCGTRFDDCDFGAWQAADSDCSGDVIA